MRFFYMKSTVQYLLIICLVLMARMPAFSGQPVDKDTNAPYAQKGEASYYAKKFEGRVTASGTVFRNDKFTAAHKTLPFGTVVKVTNLKNNRTVTVKITDRGPFVKGRVIDLSQRAARRLGMLEDGVVKVLVEVEKPAPGYAISDSGVRKK
ncbi:septal ring lytic transglycosylase RlpA family protein [Cytophagaceae bacterium ABcell3]|nr:septal ring lytic transglycosylase RlpA family protein [Cytophagaceae bacterium ABcell3]